MDRSGLDNYEIFPIFSSGLSLSKSVQYVPPISFLIDQPRATFVRLCISSVLI